VVETSRMRLIRQPGFVWSMTVVWAILLLLKLVSPGGGGGRYGWVVGAFYLGLLLVQTLFLIVVGIGALKRRGGAAATASLSPTVEATGPEDPRARATRFG
jgi:hypothetical protein